MTHRAIIIDGKKIANAILANALRLVQNQEITLAIILVGENPASQIYVRNKLLKAESLGIKTKLLELPYDISEVALLKEIEAINQDNAIDGAIIQLPLPSHIDPHQALNTLHFSKDVDGLSIYNVGLLNSWQYGLEPSTPQGALYLIKQALGSNLSGKNAVVIGRSLIVGRPMATMLTRENCSTTLLHSHSLDIIQQTKAADILVSAIGKPNIVNASYIKEGACLIDVGINRLPNNKLAGDISFDSASTVAGFITPVPGGVGPMTVCFMLLNTIKAHYIKLNKQNQYDEFYHYIQALNHIH